MMLSFPIRGSMAKPRRSGLNHSRERLGQRRFEGVHPMRQKLCRKFRNHSAEFDGLPRVRARTDNGWLPQRFFRC